MNKTVLTISDAHTVHHLAEGHIDEWWRSLPTERKVALFEGELECALPPDKPCDPASLKQYCDDFLAEMEILCQKPFGSLTALQEARDAAL